MPLTPDELHVLVAKLDEVSHDMAIHGEALKVTDRRAVRARSVARVATVAAIVGVVVGAGAVLVAVSARATADDIEASRNESRVNGCIQANVTTKANRQALVNGLLAVFPPGQEPTEMQQKIIARYTQQVDEALPYRDCSARGIDAYFAHPPIDPALPPTTTTTRG